VIPTREPPSVSAYQLRCSTGYPAISIQDGSGRLVNRAPVEGEPAIHIVLVLSNRHPGIGFLVSPTHPQLKLAVLADPDVSPVLSFVIVRKRGRMFVRLRMPTADTYVSAVPAAISADADLCANRHDPGEWEEFGLLPVALERLSPDARFLIQTIGLAFEPAFTAHSVRRWISGLPADLLTVAAIAVLRVMSPRELQVLAGWLLEIDGLFDRLRPALADDQWLARIGELRRWNIERAPLSHLSLDESADQCARESDWNRNVPLNEILFGLVRERVSPRRSICVMTTVRNEGVYLLEWIAHHRALGVEHFFIYSNQNNDGSDLLLDRLAQQGFVTWVDNKLAPGANPQFRAYKHCLSHLLQPLDFKWTILIDLDEFITLNPDRYASLGEFLSEHEQRGADAVSMHWVMMTPGGQADYRDAPLIERFTTREPEPNRHVKSAFITARHVSAHPHYPVPAFRLEQKFLNAAGRPHHGALAPNSPHEGEPNFEDAWISHYFFKSFDEWIWKMSRGFDARADLEFSLDRLEPYLRWFDAPDVVRDRRALHHLEPMLAELARLRADPGLAQAEAVSRGEFTARVARMKDLVLVQLRRSRVLKRDQRVRATMLLRGKSVPSLMSET
jgi:hypothetical protein